MFTELTTSRERVRINLNDNNTMETDEASHLDISQLQDDIKKHKLDAMCNLTRSLLAKVELHTSHECLSRRWTILKCLTQLCSQPEHCFEFMFFTSSCN